VLWMVGTAGAFLRRALATAAECESGRNGAGEGKRVRVGLKRDLGGVGRRRGQGSRHACTLVSGGSRRGRS
jgi:hypothetical protein